MSHPTCSHRHIGSRPRPCLVTSSHPCMCTWLFERPLPYLSLYFFLKSFFHLFLIPAMVPDENSMEDPLCNSAIGSMVSLDYVTPDTVMGKTMMNVADTSRQQFLLQDAVKYIRLEKPWSAVITRTCGLRLNMLALANLVKAVCTKQVRDSTRPLLVGEQCLTIIPRGCEW